MNSPKSRILSGDFAEKLEKLADEIESSKQFSVTRLTPIKRLCADHDVTLRFATHFANLAYQKFQDEGIPEPTTADQREKIGAAIESGMKILSTFHCHPSSIESTNHVFSAYSLLRKAQDEYKKGHWGRIRIIYSKEALIIETALACQLRPMDSPSLCYQIARDHAERYDPSFGTGLIPASADAVREIARFFRDEARRLTE